MEQTKCSECHQLLADTIYVLCNKGRCKDVPLHTPNCLHFHNSTHHSTAYADTDGGRGMRYGSLGAMDRD